MKSILPFIVLATSVIFSSCVLDKENPVSSSNDAASLVTIAVGTYPSISPDGRKLAFSRSGAIFISDTNGHNAIQLTSGTFDDIMPQWSPNGQRVGFIRKKNNQQGNGTLMIVDSATKIAQSISTTDSVNCQLESVQAPYANSGSNPYASAPFWSWSPDGSKIAFYSGNDSLTTLSIVKSDGSGNASGKFTLYNHHQFDYSGNCSGFCWLPFGDQIICASNSYNDTSCLYAITIGIDTMIRMSDKKGVTNPTCSSDGRIVGYKSNDYPGYQLIDLQTDFVSTLYYAWYSPKLSPDGKKVVSYSYSYSGNPAEAAGSQLNCTDVSTGLSSFLVQSDWDYNFVFHPSSKWVFFTRGGEIFRVDLGN